MMTAATRGRKVIILRMGKFIIHLLEQSHNGFVDNFQNPRGPDAGDQD
jgi:hypothetical protein